MKIVLIKDTPKVGRIYDIKEVANGFALNYLIPRGYALTATDSLIAETEDKRKEIEQARIKREALLAEQADAIDNIEIEISRKANEQGHLFAGVSIPEILEEVKKQANLEIDEEFILMKRPIKAIGKHEVTVRVADKEPSITVKVIPQE